MWNQKCYLGEPGGHAGRGGAGNHRWRNFLDDLKKSRWDRKEKHRKCKSRYMTLYGGKHASSSPLPFLLHTFWCYTNTHRHTHQQIGSERFPSLVVTSLATRNAQNKALDTGGNVKKGGKKEEKFACKWIPQAAPMHQNNGDTRDKTTTSERCAVRHVLKGKKSEKLLVKCGLFSSIIACSWGGFALADK